MGQCSTDTYSWGGGGRGSKKGGGGGGWGSEGREKLLGHMPTLS